MKTKLARGGPISNGFGGKRREEGETEDRRRRRVQRDLPERDYGFR